MWLQAVGLSPAEQQGEEPGKQPQVLPQTPSLPLGPSFSQLPHMQMRSCCQSAGSEEPRQQRCWPPEKVASSLMLEDIKQAGGRDESALAFRCSWMVRDGAHHGLDPSFRFHSSRPEERPLGVWPSSRRCLKCEKVRCNWPVSAQPPAA